MYRTFGTRPALLTSLVLASLLTAACDERSTPTLGPSDPFGSAVSAKQGNGGSKNAKDTKDRILMFSDKEEASGELYSMNPDGTGVTRLTFSAGPDNSGVWSPDGRRIAFVSSRHDFKGEIYVMDADGSNVTRLTNSPGADAMPSWSKDGKRIAFASTRDAVDPTTATSDELEIYVMNDDGSNVVRLTTNAVKDGWPAWSPDGRLIAFASARDQVDPSKSDIYTVRPDGTGVSRITYEGRATVAPEWSPSGDQIAFWNEDGIFITSADGLQVTALALGQDLGGPVWSEDGNQLAYFKGPPLQQQVHRINADGSGDVQLTFQPGRAWPTAWRR